MQRNNLESQTGPIEIKNHCNIMLESRQLFVIPSNGMQVVHRY